MPIPLLESSLALHIDHRSTASLLFQEAFYSEDSGRQN